MPVKRSRMGRSTTSMDTLPRPPPAERHAERVPEGSSVRAVATEERSGEVQPVILAVSSPARPSGVETRGGFLERCYNCKKALKKDADVFMYSYLRAFCSIECREKQITIDNVAAGIVSRAANGGTN